VPIFAYIPLIKVKALAILLVLVSLVHHELAAQKKETCLPTSDKKALKYFEKALEYRKEKKPFEEIRAQIERALALDSNYADALEFLGNLAWQSKRDQIMVESYEKLILACPDASADAYYRLGDFYYNSGSFGKAIKSFRSFLEFDQVKEDIARDVERKIIRAEFKSKPVPFNPVPLKDICSADPEYLAIISPDQEYCFYTRRFEEQNRGSLYPVTVEKFMISKKDGEHFSKGEPMPPPFNKKGSNNEGGASISIDNRNLFFTVNKNENFDIYTSSENNGVWSEPVSAGRSVNDPERWESQPSISPDGKSLYFVSIRDSVNQTSDIYFSRKNSDGSWAPARPVGAPVNTTGNEKTPFLHPDNNTLYFSSDYHKGLGGYDIFMCRRRQDGSWSDPVNLGYPINTEADELGFFVSTDGKIGYFASNNLKGVGGYDVYSFDLHEEVRPLKVLFIKGELKDEDNEAPGNTSIVLRNTQTMEMADVSYDSSSGRYASVVLFDNDYILTVKKQGYAYTSAYFSASDTVRPEPRKMDFKLKTTSVGQSYQLDNIHFETESARLTRQDSVIIRDFSFYLKEEPGLKVALQGHTDNSGSPQQNQILSEKRAKAVFDFLVECEIPSVRLSYQGFGQSKPVADNLTEEGRAKNRRTEFVIVSK